LNDKVYQELYKPLLIQRQMDKKREQLETIKHMATDIAVHMDITGVRSRGSGESRQERYAIKAEQLGDELADLALQLSEAQTIIEARVARMSDHDEVRFIETAFIHHTRWTYRGGKDGKPHANTVKSRALQHYQTIYFEMEEKPAEGATV